MWRLVLSTVALLSIGANNCAYAAESTNSSHEVLLQAKAYTHSNSDGLVRANTIRKRGLVRVAQSDRSIGAQMVQVSEVVHGRTTISEDGRSVFHLFYRGDIAAGDLSKLQAAIGRLKDKSGAIEGTIALHLDSGGGSFEEALRVARYILQGGNDGSDGISTHVDGDAVCYSACAIVFLAGHTRHHNAWDEPDRYLSPNGVLGFHAPYLEFDGDNPSREHVETAYDYAVKNIASFVSLAGSLGLRESLLPEILEKGRKEFLLINDVDKLGRYKVALTVKPPGKISPDVLNNYCANAYAWQRNELSAPYRSGDGRDSEGDSTWNELPSYLDIQRGVFPVINYKVRTIIQRGSLPISRYIIPVAPGDEALVIKCIVDVIEDDGRQTFICQGFSSVEEPEQIWAIAEFQPATACSSPPLFALAPPDTPHSQVQRVIELYEQRSHSAASSGIATKPGRANVTQITPAPPSGTQHATAPLGTSLIQTLSTSKWAINSANGCTDRLKVYSLIQSGNDVIWKGGTGSVNEERVRFADSSTLVTVTARSTSGTVRGTTWTYKRLPTGGIRVSASGKGDFTLVPCSTEQRQSKEMPGAGTGRPGPSKNGAAISGLLTSWYSLNAQCRGGLGDRPETHNACKQREKLSATLEKSDCVYRPGDRWACRGFTPDCQYKTQVGAVVCQ